MKSNLNIIVKKDSSIPAYRALLQPRLSHFHSLDKRDSKKVDMSISVEAQFDPDELARIQNAVRFTREAGLEEIQLKEQKGRLGIK